MAQKTNQSYPPWIKDLIYLAIILIGLFAGILRMESRVSVVEARLQLLEEERSKYIPDINEKVTEIQRLLEEKQKR